MLHGIAVGIVGLCAAVAVMALAALIVGGGTETDWTPELKGASVGVLAGMLLMWLLMQL